MQPDKINSGLSAEQIRDNNIKHIDAIASKASFSERHKNELDTLVRSICRGDKKAETYFEMKVSFLNKGVILNSYETPVIESLNHALNSLIMGKEVVLGLIPKQEAIIEKHAYDLLKRTTKLPPYLREDIKVEKSEKPKEKEFKPEAFKKEFKPKKNEGSTKGLQDLYNTVGNGKNKDYLKNFKDDFERFMINVTKSGLEKSVQAARTNFMKLVQEKYDIASTTSKYAMVKEMVDGFTSHRLTQLGAVISGK